MDGDSPKGGKFGKLLAWVYFYILHQHVFSPNGEMFILISLDSARWASSRWCIKKWRWQRGASKFCLGYPFTCPHQPVLRFFENKLGQLEFNETLRFFRDKGLPELDASKIAETSWPLFPAARSAKYAPAETFICFAYFFLVWIFGAHGKSRWAKGAMKWSAAMFECFDPN